MIYDDVGRHFGEAGGFDEAALPLGVYLAWCANHGLLSEELEGRAGHLVTRVRYREVGGCELAVAGCGGILADEHLNADGRAFTSSHYDQFLDTFRELCHDQPTGDEWAVYDRLAPELTRALMRFRGHRREQPSVPAGRWWRRWWRR